MSEVKNILVLPAGTEIAMEINSALKYSRFVRLFGGTDTPCHAKFVFEHCAEGIPSPDSPDFAAKVNAVVDAFHIDYIYPAHSHTLLKLTELCSELHAAVVTSAPETVRITASPKKTFEYLAGASYLPKTFANADEISSYPVFIRPAAGQGSEDAKKISGRHSLDEALADGVEYAICEYLPGEELTVDCFTDRYGALRIVCPRTRSRIRAGISVRSETLPCSEELRGIAEDINLRFSFNGAWFFQLRKNSAGQYRLLKIAPRIAGSMSVTRNLGINLPLLTLFNMWGSDTDIIRNDTEILMDRAFISRFETDIEYDNVYVDFDDTIVVNGKVNGFLMMFLYQAREKGKKLYLLTKHARDIEKSMEQYAVCPELFDEIIHIPREGDKTQYIKPRSVFIDDSFAERKRVSEKCGAAVFDLDMIESLLDWRV